MTFDGGCTMSICEGQIRVEKADQRIKIAPEFLGQHEMDGLRVRLTDEVMYVIVGVDPLTQTFLAERTYL